MKNILVLDDERSVTMLVQGILSTHYYRSESVSCPHEAQERLRSRKFDLLITDFLMPEIDGLQLCESIRQDTKMRALKLIILSGKEMTGAERTRFAELDVLLLNKPFSSLSLKDSIDKVFT